LYKILTWFSILKICLLQLKIEKFNTFLFND